LGYQAPASYSRFGQLTSIPEETGVPVAQDMIRQLSEGHETLIRTARNLLPAVERAQDQTTLDLLADRMQIHEKTAWMLRSMLT
jgi:starvation-inducible DNA-binding protein